MLTQISLISICISISLASEMKKSPLCIDQNKDCPEFELVDIRSTNGVKFEIRNYSPMKLLFTKLPYLSMNFTFATGSQKLDLYTSKLKDENGTKIGAYGPKMMFYMIPDFSAIMVAQYAPDSLQDPQIEAPEFEMLYVESMMAPAGTKFTKTLKAEEIGYGIEVKQEIAEFVQALKTESFEKFMEQKIVVYSENPLKAEIWIVHGDDDGRLEHKQQSRNRKNLRSTDSIQTR